VPPYLAPLLGITSQAAHSTVWALGRWAMVVHGRGLFCALLWQRILIIILCHVIFRAWGVVISILRTTRTVLLGCSD
jgi:hypothetical protein